jgi:hypothetical protein
MLGSFSAVLRTLGVSTLLFALAACNSGGNGSLKNPGPTGDFEITLGAVGTLVEGADQALFIPVMMSRSNEYAGTVTLQLEGASVDDVANLSGRLSSEALSPGNDSSGVLLDLAIADLPLLPQSRRLTVIATDGIDEHRLQFDVPVEPVDAPDIYLLVGQSNMVGFSGDGTRDSGPGGLDESNPRILQLNASGNDQFNVFTSEQDFTDVASNVRTPAIVVAEDPLHVPRDAEGADGAAKSLDYIGLGLSFAKTALLNTSQNVILVPAAWSGSAFCNNEGGPNGQWNAGPVTSPELGNTWLFDRAVTRANAAIEETGGILRGILWHQGESDSNSRCAPLYLDNLRRLAEALRQNITLDRRGAELRQADANIPFIVGTMSRGDDVAVFSDAKQTIDLAHRGAPNVLAHTALSNHDDLVPPGFPCGNDGCIHFGADALREMGRRYYAALLRASSSEIRSSLVISD